MTNKRSRFDYILDALDGVGFTGFRVDVHYRAAQSDAAFGNRKAFRHQGDEAFDDRHETAPEHGILWAAHAGVGEVGGAAWEDTLVSRLDVGVGADDCGNFAVEAPPKGDFFGSRFGMEVDENDFHTVLVTQAVDFRGDDGEWIVESWLNERPALRVNDGDLAVIGIEDDAACAGCAFGPVDRAEQSRLGGEVGDDFLLIPHVVTGRNDGGTSAEKFNADLRCNSAASRGVLAIDDNEVGLVFLFECIEALDHCFATGLAHDIS